MLIMRNSRHSRSLHYDANGDIVVDQSAPEKKAAAPEPEHIENGAHSRLSRHTHDELKKAQVKPVHFFKEQKQESATEKTRKQTSSVISEGRRQIRAAEGSFLQSVLSARRTVRSFPKTVRQTLSGFWRVCLTPIPLPWAKSEKKRSRATLFFLDTVRFGGTFAGIFVVLFVGINYQSFMAIARAQLALGGDTKTEEALQEMVQGSDADPELVSGAISRVYRVPSLIRFLPPVGPFEDRIVIPKLGKNVPIVRPSMDALLKEDWKQFESDIQTALEDGIVHYPGSARPGQPGNFFLTGHSSYYPWAEGDYKDVFARLPELEIGDTYSVYYGGDKHVYRIAEKKEVRPNNVTVLDQPTNKRLATLMTCTPVGTTIRRLILVAEEIDPLTGSPLRVGERVTEQKSLFTRMSTLPI